MHSSLRLFFSPYRAAHSSHRTAGYAYGIKNLRNLPEEGEPIKMAIVDMGHSALTVAVYAMTRTEMKVLATAHELDMGGQAVDRAMMTHFVEVIKQKHKMDVSQNPRAMLRLQTACEKLKKVLSANPEAPLQVESIMNDIDVRVSYTRDELESIIQPILARVKNTCARALDRSGTCLLLLCVLFRALHVSSV
jgi:molecular chaperone DnaK (HSP70)